MSPFECSTLLQNNFLNTRFGSQWMALLKSFSTIIKELAIHFVQYWWISIESYCLYSCVLRWMEPNMWKTSRKENSKQSTQKVQLYWWTNYQDFLTWLGLCISSNRAYNSYKLLSSSNNKFKHYESSGICNLTYLYMICSYWYQLLVIFKRNWHFEGDQCSCNIDRMRTYSRPSINY